MKAWLARYNKFYTAAAGLGLLFVMRQADVDIPGIPEMVAEMVLSLFTAWGVYQVPNAKPEEDHDPEDIRGV